MYRPPQQIKQSISQKGSTFQDELNSNSDSKSKSKKQFLEIMNSQRKENKSNSMLSLNPSKGSMMKIVVLEENGNALIEQEYDENEEEEDEQMEKDMMDEQSRSVSVLQFETKLKQQELETIGAKTFPYTNAVTTRKTILEGETNFISGCCKRECLIF